MISSSARLIAQSHPKLAKKLELMDRAESEALLRELISTIPESFLEHPAITEYRAAVCTGQPLTSQMTDTLQKLSEALDQEYFRLQQDEGMPEEVWSLKFHQARLAAALALMSSGTSCLADIVYEYSHAYDPPDTILNRIADMLSK